MERLGDRDTEGSSTNPSGAKPANLREAPQYKVPPMLRPSNWLLKLIEITAHLKKQRIENFQTLRMVVVAKIQRN